MLNTRSENEHTVFYSYLACFVSTLTLDSYGFLSYRVHQAEYGIHILVAASQEHVNTYSTRRIGTAFRIELKRSHARPGAFWYPRASFSFSFVSRD